QPDHAVGSARQAHREAEMVLHEFQIPAVNSSLNASDDSPAEHKSLNSQCGMTSLLILADI
ncbi:MAG: hypothetical protein ACK58T_01755, partial [Phycisphaerae bacterium]